MVVIFICFLIHRERFSMYEEADTLYFLLHSKAMGIHMLVVPVS